MGRNNKHTREILAAMNETAVINRWIEEVIPYFNGDEVKEAAFTNKLNEEDFLEIVDEYFFYLTENARDYGIQKGYKKMAVTISRPLLLKNGRPVKDADGAAIFCKYENMEEEATLFTLQHKDSQKRNHPILDPSELLTEILFYRRESWTSKSSAVEFTPAFLRVAYYDDFDPVEAFQWSVEDGVFIPQEVKSEDSEFQNKLALKPGLNMFKAVAREFSALESVEGLTLLSRPIEERNSLMELAESLRDEFLNNLTEGDYKITSSLTPTPIFFGWDGENLVMADDNPFYQELLWGEEDEGGTLTAEEEEFLTRLEALSSDESDEQIRLINEELMKEGLDLEQAAAEMEEYFSLTSLQSVAASEVNSLFEQLFVTSSLILSGVMDEAVGLTLRRLGEEEDEVMGWLIHSEGVRPSSAQECIEAYCVDTVTGELLDPEPKTKYCDAFTFGKMD